MKTKRLIALLLCAMLVFTACSVKTKNQATGGEVISNTDNKTNNAPVPVTILTEKAYQTELNVIRDQLIKAGFEVTVNMQPDGASVTKLLQAGEYDLYLFSWGSPTGNPDYGARGLFHSLGDFNNSPIKDAKVDELIDKAAGLSAEESLAVYSDLEKYIVGEKTYMVPVYRSPKIVSVNKNIVDPTSINHGSAVHRLWALNRYNDPSLNETRPYVSSYPYTNPPGFDPVRVNQGATGQPMYNTYIRIVCMDTKDQITTDNSLSYNYSIKEGNKEYYFILRDDINFAKIVDKKAVDTDMLVSAEDVIYTFNRIMNKDSAPTNRINSMLALMEDATIVTDIEELKNNKSDDGRSIYDVLSDGLKSKFTDLASDKTDVDNSKGKYQVVKVTTSKPFPQILNFLQHQGCGIVSEEIVSKVNEGIDATNYDANTHILYGDSATLRDGTPTYNNQLYCSGPYALLYLDDYSLVYERNPGFAPGTDMAPTIKYFTLKMIPDNANMVSALRSGEIDEAVPVENNIKIVEADPNIATLKTDSHSVRGVQFNLTGKSKMSDENLRKAVLYAVNQEEIISVKNGLGSTANSVLSMIKTDNYIPADLNKAKDYLNKYYELKK